MRTRLPNRRPSVVAEAYWGGEKLHIGIGFDLAGRPREIFLNGHKVGSEMQSLMQDAAVAVSIALQNGADLGALVTSMGRAEDHSPTSLLGLVLREASHAAEGQT